MTEAARSILVASAAGARAAADLSRALGYSTRTGNFKKALGKLLSLGFLEQTIPDKPQSSKQRYRITPLGREFLKKDKEKN